MKKDDDYFQANIDDEDLKWHPTLNFYLPHEFGGCGAPFYEKPKYNLFNIYTPEHDLAIIRPKWTHTHDFKIDLPRNTKLDDPIEEDDIEP